MCSFSAVGQANIRNNLTTQTTKPDFRPEKLSKKSRRLTTKLWAARIPHQLTAMDYTKHPVASTTLLILHQLDQQDQLQCDTRNNKTPLGPSTPAPCWVDLR